MRSSHEVEQLLEELRAKWPPECTVVPQVTRRIQQFDIESLSPPAPKRHDRAALALAAVVALVATTWWVVALGDNSLYAQVLRAIENARTVQSTTWAIPGGDQPAQPAIRSWFERNKGFRVESPQEIRLGHENYFWTYRKNDDVAFRFSTESINDQIDRELDLRRTLDELQRGGFERFVEGDEVVDGQQLTAYLLAETDRVADPALRAPTVRAIAFLDERSRIVRARMDFLQGDQWISRVLTEWQYDVPIDRAMFEPDFGDSVQIVDSDAAFDQLAKLDDALYREERRGIIFAIHRLQRFDNHGVLVVSSVRAAPDILERYPLDSRRIQPGLYLTEGPARNLQTSPQGDGYFRIEMARVAARGIDLSWWVLVPRLTNSPPYEENAETLKLPLGFTPVGWTAYGKTFADDQGVLQHVTWEAVVDAPDSDKVVSLANIADMIYADMTALRAFPFRELFFGSKPGTNVLDVRSPDGASISDFRKGAERNIHGWYERDLRFALEEQFTEEVKRESARWGTPAISLSYNPLVSDRTMSEIAKRTSVERLFLDGTGVTDQGLAELAPLRALQVIGLNNTQITDDGLEQLKELPSLKQIQVRGTRVTSAGVERFRLIRPQVSVED